jgi:uracil-DNA glycosylase
MEQDRQEQLETLQRDIRACTQCVGSGYIPVAKPVVRGRADHRVMVIGQAPGPGSLTNDVPWSGQSGKLLRAWFERAGFDPGHFLDDWYFTSLTKCFPGKAKSSAGDRAPSAAERSLCRPFLNGEIAIVQPRLVVTLGRMAADAIIPGARASTLRDLVGTMHEVDFGYGTVPVLPFPHPSGVGRWLNDPDNRALVDKALASLAGMREAAVPGLLDIIPAQAER